MPPKAISTSVATDRLDPGLGAPAAGQKVSVVAITLQIPRSISDRNYFVNPQGCTRPRRLRPGQGVRPFASLATSSDIHPIPARCLSGWWTRSPSTPHPGPYHRESKTTLAPVDMQKATTTGGCWRGCRGCRQGRLASRPGRGIPRGASCRTDVSAPGGEGALSDIDGLREAGRLVALGHVTLALDGFRHRKQQADELRLQRY